MDDFAAELGIDFKTSSLKDAESDSLKLQKAMEGVEAAASGLESGINSANKAAGDLTGKTGALDSAMESLGMGAKDAGSSVKALGDDTESTARKQTAFLASLKAQADTLGKSKSDILAYRAAQLGLGEQAAGDIAKLKAFESGVTGVAEKTKLTTHEMMNLSVQVKDFSESIISGQNPLKAFVQQMLTANTIVGQAGVSWKNVLSQVGSGIGSLVTRFGGLILAGTAVAAAVGAVVIALNEMHNGAEESIKVINSLNATGRAAGVTSADFYSMADAIHESTGKSAQEVRGLELQVVQSGKVMGENVGLLTETAINLSKAMGTDAKKSMESLLPLFGDTTKAAAQLNETYHFLTGGLYEQIKAMQESGDAQGAAALAMQALNGQVGHQVENLGILEQSWKGLKDMIGQATNSLMNWGKVQTADDKSVSAQKSIDARIAVLKNAKEQTAKGNVSGRGAFTDTQQAELTALQNQKILLDAQVNSIKEINNQESIRKQQTAQIASQLSSGPSGQLTALKQQRAQLQAAIDAGGDGFSMKDLTQQAKYLDEQINRVTKSYDGFKKSTKEKLPKLTVFDSADTAKAVMTFDNAFNKGLFDAMQKGTKIVDTAIKQINAKLAEVGSMKILNSNINSGSSLDSFNSWSDYAQAYKEAVTNLKEGEVLSQQVVYDAYQELQARRKISEEYDKILKVGERIKALDQKTATDGAVDSLTSASDQFWDTFLTNGKGSISDLGVSLKDIFLKQASAGLKAGFEPVLEGLRTSLKSVFDDVFKSAKDGISTLLEKVGVLKKGSDGSYSFNSSSVAGKAASSVISAYAGYSTGQSIVSATGLNGKTAAQQLNSSIGSAVGAAIGTALPGIGTVLGSVIGGILGGLLGPKSADNRAAANLTASGSISGSIYGKPTDETSSALSSAISAISSGYDAIKSLGGTLSTTITSLHIGNRDQSQATLSNGQTVNTGSVGDAADLANDALLSVLKNTKLASDSLNKVKDALINSGQGFDDTTSALSSVKGVLEALDTPLSDWQTNLKSISDVFEPLIAETGKYSAALTEAYNTAKSELATSFNNDIADQLLKERSSIAGQYSDMLKTQAERVSDAIALGGDLNQVLALNSEETQNFIDSLASSYSSIADLTDAYNQLKTQMTASGQDTSALDTSYASAKNDLKTTFDSSTADSLLQASNETLYNLEQMLKTQKDRIADATALGANLAAVDRLNAVETSNFFKNLSDTEKLQLGDYLGLIEDYTGKIGVVGSKLLDALDPLISGIDDTINTLKDTSANLRSLATSIGDTSQSIKDQYSNTTPIASINSLRDQFKSTAASAIGGDQDALAKLSDLANTLIERSRTNYGSTAQFSSDYNLVTSLLDQASASATSGADAADTQIEALNSQIDLLTEIKNILGDSDPQLDTLANDLSQLSGTFGDVKNLLGQYLTLSAAQDGATLSDSQLQTLATLVSSSVANDNATTQAVSYADATTGQTAQTTNTVSASTTSQSSTDTALAALTGYFQALQKQLSDQQDTNVTLQQQIITLQRQIAQNTAKAV